MSDIDPVKEADMQFASRFARGVHRARTQGFADLESLYLDRIRRLGSYHGESWTVTYLLERA